MAAGAKITVKTKSQYKSLQLLLKLCEVESKFTVEEGEVLEARLPDKVLIGFTTICKYIVKNSDNAISKQLLQDTPISIAKNAEWLVYIQSELDPLMDAKLREVNSYLSNRVYLFGNSYSLADVLLYVTVNPAVSEFPVAQLSQFSHLLRWYDLMQNVVDKYNILQKVVIKKPFFDFKKHIMPDGHAKGKEGSVATVAEKKEINEVKKDGGKNNGAAVVQNNSKTKNQEKVDGDDNKNLKDKESKKKAKKEPAAPKNADVGIDVLDMRIGKILKVEKHQNADGLYVEQIDLGEDTPRQVVSGLVKFVSLEQMQNRSVVVVCNLKAANMRGVESRGMVLCASDTAHEKCEPLNPPPDSMPGDKVYCQGCQSQAPMDEIKPKQKILEKLFPDLVTDDEGIAKYKEFVIQTDKGPLRASITNGLVR